MSAYEPLVLMRLVDRTYRGRPLPLVAFGHMHHRLQTGERRNMVRVDEGSGTVFLNTAVVPRWRPALDIRKEVAQDLARSHAAQARLAAGGTQPLHPGQFPGPLHYRVGAELGAGRRLAAKAGA